MTDRCGALILRSHEQSDAIAGMRAGSFAVASSIVLAGAVLLHTEGCGRGPISTLRADHYKDAGAVTPDADIDRAERSTASDTPNDVAAVVVAIIDQSASTNARSSEVVVYSDGSAVRTVGPPRMGSLLLPDGGSVPMGPSPETFPPGSQEVMQLLADLAAVGDVSAIATSWCPKSISFGTTTTVWADGKQSGDLQCADAPSTVQAAFISDCLL
jgi:hypothetical protein